MNGCEHWKGGVRVGSWGEWKGTFCGMLRGWIRWSVGVFDMMTRLFLMIGVLWLSALGGASAMAESRRELRYAPAPIDNPLKGLVPYQGDVRGDFPHSMEFSYLPYSALVKGYEEFDWQPMETMLDAMASRGHQAVFRIFLEYPNRKGCLPDFLLRDGLKVYRYLNTNTQPLPPAEVETPDYEDGNLRRSMKAFIAALGRKYDGDPRIGFITAGLLGTWGEWHTHPRNELFASKAVQEEVMDAYEAAFRVTPVLLRYPVGEGASGKARNDHRKFGYHDDSFGWATLDTGKKNEKWFYMSSLKAAGPGAEAKWKTQPIGGEIRPEAWGKVFDEDPGMEHIQGFAECVEATHASWVMDSGMFGRKQGVERVERAKAQVRRMGYEFYCRGVTMEGGTDGRWVVKLEIENRGVAPFYYDWRLEYGLLSGGKVVWKKSGTGQLTGILPGEKPRMWEETLDLGGVRGGTHVLGVRVVNPLSGGRPVRFANETQDADAEGWLSLGVVEVR